GWHLDTPYLAVDLGEESWLSLKNALRCGESAPPEDQTTLANVRSDMGYTLAAANTSSKLPGIRTAWEQAWTGQ
ncbi:MAG: hypothetical protein IT430_20570, partial [Phycisphaerales bacterium]|nr:hypothetical protein [Phycisphaerales bacterium]